jgi:hypothetical protein
MLKSAGAWGWQRNRFSSVNAEPCTDHATDRRDVAGITHKKKAGTSRPFGSFVAAVYCSSVLIDSMSLTSAVPADLLQQQLVQDELVAGLRVGAFGLGQRLDRQQHVGHRLVPTS